MTMQRIRKGDTVIVLSGKSKGIKGRVLRVLKNDKILVEGANLVKKHVKPNPQANEPGGILDREAAIHVSNVALTLPLKKGQSAKQWSKVGFKRLEDGRKVRYFKVNNELVDVT